MLERNSSFDFWLWPWRKPRFELKERTDSSTQQPESQTFEGESFGWLWVMRDVGQNKITLTLQHYGWIPIHYRPRKTGFPTRQDPPHRSSSKGYCCLAEVIRLYVLKWHHCITNFKIYWFVWSGGSSLWFVEALSRRAAWGSFGRMHSSRLLRTLRNLSLCSPAVRQWHE